MAGMYGCFKSRNSDSAAMASGPPDVMTNQEPAEVVEECSGKKKSKFQTFKKFFARKKRKDPPATGADVGLKASQSSDNVSKTSENNTLTRSENDKGSGSKISLGSKALSHDSVFVSDSSEANEALRASQDSIHGKVKSLQLQLKQAIRLGSPPSIICVKRTEDGGAMSEDDGLPCSPPEYTALHTVMNQAQRNSSISLEGIDSDDDQLSCAASSRAVSPLVVPGDFSQPASPFGCLDNSAAKHKLGLRNKACNKRKPVSRLDLRTESESVVEMSNSPATEASEEQTTEVVRRVALKPKVERKEVEEQEEEKEEEEEEQPQHSRQSLLRDKEEREEGEDESEAEQDVSRSLDTSSPPELGLAEEDVADAQHSTEPGSRASSLDSPRATPEPPANPREYLLDPPGVAYGAEENREENELVLGGEDDEVQEGREEESSFLQEVLSSLKTPLSSDSLSMETEGVVLEIEEDMREEEEGREDKDEDKGEEVMEEEREDVDAEEGEEVKEEESEVDEPVGHQAAPADSLHSDQTTEEEVTTLSMSYPSHQDVEEEEEGEEEEAEEEELVVEHFSQHCQKEDGEKEEAEEVQPEETHDVLMANTVKLTEDKDEESEREEETIELEEPEVEEEEEEQEKRDEDNEEVELKEAKERIEEAEEAIEEEREHTEEVMEELPAAADEDAEVVVENNTQQLTSDDNHPTESDDQEFSVTCESQAASNQSFGEEREDREARVEEGVEIDHKEHKSDGEEDGEVHPEADQTEQEVAQEDVEMDLNQAGRDQTEATVQTRASKPSSLSLPEPHSEPPESGPITPSKTSTTILHINLLSPSSEKVAPFFQQSTPAAIAKESETPPPAVASTEEKTVSTEEEDPIEAVEEEKLLVVEDEATPPASVQETVSPPPSGSDQSKVRFTIAPAWQRSLSTEDPKESSTYSSSPPACVSTSVPGGVEVEAEVKKDPEPKEELASPAKVELVLSPGRARNAGVTAAKPQSNAAAPPSPSKHQTTAADSTDECSVKSEGNPDNPFGVRLRKTTVLHRFGSEEENAEPPVEPPAQPTSCKVDPPQPISAKPSISQPISSKPALPKKPDVHGDSGGKNKRISEPAAARGVSSGSDSPSWISVAKQKQKIYKESSLEEINVKKEEQERKSSLPMYVSSAVSRESTSKATPETSKTSASVEKEARRALSPPTPVPAQPPKPQSLPCPVPPKPQIPPATAKYPPQRALSPPTPVPVPQKSPSCTSPQPPSNTATSPKTPQPLSTTVTSPPFSSRTAPEKSGSRAPGLSSQTPSSQRGLPPPALPQDEPPWMALAKKKAKAWSEMPQIVQ